ncbi:MAG TPA: PHP domain-containing protein, partial [Candidatus Janibacter merdipullorum]|nr:PHP domain-containing protein [Candidatus Janibacter merdipullorum]
MRSLAPLSAPVAPVDALRRVGFLLERSRQHSRRVEAFRGAAATLREVDEGEVAQRVEEGTITELAGIGKSTAGVIEQAVRGELPDYLARQQEEHGSPLVEGGEAYTEAIIGDCHLHSDWSDGGSPIEEMVLTAVELGQEWMVLTDHSPRLRIANGLSAARLAEQLTLLGRIDASLGDAFTVMSGIEVDILDDGELDQTPEMLDRLDLVTA